jgi:hypothetical protein
MLEGEMNYGKWTYLAKSAQGRQSNGAEGVFY